MGEGGHIGSDAFFLIDPVVQPDHGGLDIDVVLGAGHQQVHVVSFRQRARLVLADLLLLYICLVGEDEDGDVLDRELLDLLHPDLDRVEGGLVGHRVDQQDAHRRPVVGGSQAAEPLLPSSVPHLHQHVLIADVDDAFPVVQAHRGRLPFLEGLLAELAQDGGLADVAVADEDVLDYLVVGPVIHEMTQSQRGKQIKDYILGETLVNYNDMHLLEGRRAKGDEVTVLMIEKKCMQQETFLPYNNLLAENKLAIHPHYLEVIQSANNIYIVVEKITKIPAGFSWAQLLPGLVELYRRMGEFKLEESEIFVTGQGRVVYMPFYKRMQMTSKFYAQFHNKSVLGDLFSKLLPLPNKNIALDIFIRNIDNPKAVEIITAEISREIQAESGGSSPENGLYPSVSFQNDEQDDDEAIMQLMSKVKVNSDMKKEAGEQFLRLSAKRQEEREDKEIKNIIQNVESSMFKMAPIKRSTDRSKMDKLSESRMQEEKKSEQNSFELYFKAYFESLRFLKKSIKEFLSYYKNGFAGIISSFLLALIVTLRKAYMIRQLQSRNDIFELQIDMRAIPVNKYVGLLKRDMKSEARMVCEFKSVIENCSMPMKTYSILAPYLEDDISLVDFQQLHTFAFFFLSALLKNKEYRHMHFLHVVDCMYILLHRNYEIVFFQAQFPRQWDQKYWDEKIALIQSLVPSWTF